MTDFASLVIQVDSREVEKGAKELDGLTAAAGRTEQSTKKLVPAMNQVTVSAGQQRAGMQQLSYQIGDVAQQFALGTNPMIIFAQQGGQVVQALSLMRGGATGLLGVLGGPWGAVIMGAATVAGMFASSLWESGDAAEDAAKSYDTAAEAAKGLIGAMNAVALAKRQISLNEKRDRALQLENQISSRPRNSATGQPMFSYKDQQELAGLRWQITEESSIVALAEEQNRKLTQTRTTAAKAATAHTSATRGSTAALRDYNKQAEALIRLQNDVNGGIMRQILTGVGNGAMFGEGTIENETARLIRDFSRDANAESDSRTSTMRSEAEATAYLREQYGALAQSLSGLGKGGQLLGGLAGLLGGGGVGAIGGKAGFLLNAISSVSVRGKDGSIEKLGDRIVGIFKGKDGAFGSTMLDILQGGGMGIAASSVFLGGKGSTTGSGIGGALGGAAFEKFAGEGLKKALGSFGGPLASIAGGLIGGALGGLMKKTKSGAANITGMGSASLSGNSGGFKAAASGAAGGVQSSLQGIAEALGGSVGGFNVTIGQRHGDWRVREGAGSLKIKKGAKEFDGDEAGAIKYAISLAIQQGAITGLKASTQALLKGGSDIEKQLEKALSWQGAFDELEQRTDPVAYALRKISDEFANLTKIAGEAGASAEEYAKIEELMAMKRKDAMAEATDSLREFLAGFEAGPNSPYSLRQQSTSAMASLQPFLDAINAGKSVDQDKYLNAAQTYLDVQRQMDASGSGYFNALDMVKAATGKAVSNIENVVSMNEAASTTAQNTTAMSNMMSDQTNLLQAINDNLTTIAANGLYGGAEWFNDLRNFR